MEFKTWKEASAYAWKAVQDGIPRGIEQNKLFKFWRVFMLPAKAYRCGHELRCEAVEPRKT